MLASASPSLDPLSASLAARHFDGISMSVHMQCAVHWGVSRAGGYHRDTELRAIPRGAPLTDPLQDTLEAARTERPVKVDGRRSFSRDEIKSIALELFHERGFKSVSVRDIMDQHGLTPGAMYNHFESKEDLLSSIILDSVEGIELYIGQAVGVSGLDDAPSLLAALAYAHALFQCNHPQLARVGVQEMQHVPQRRHIEMRARLQHVRDEFEKATIKGIEDGVFDATYPDVVVMEFLGMGTKISDWYHQSGRLRPETIAEVHARLVLRMVGYAEPEVVFDKLRGQLGKTVGRAQ
jgi:AcrR family transcriptional regulator